MPVKKVISSTRKLVNSKTRVSEKPGNEKTRKRVASNLSVPVYSLAGKITSEMSLPKEIFGAKVNNQLLSQAIRVYSTNQKTLLANTKTRGEVEGSTAKIYRQKGTGRARHGGIRAPIFVGGGIVFGPQPRKVRLSLPKKMRRAALISALSSKILEKGVMGLTGVEKASGKTKEIVELLTKINSKNKKSFLIVLGEKQDNIFKGVRNIPGVDAIQADTINALEVLKHEFLMITKEAIDKLNPKNELEKEPKSVVERKTKLSSRI